MCSEQRVGWDATGKPRPEVAALPDASISCDVDSLSDADLLQSVTWALERNPVVPWGRVKPVVRNGWVTLEGAVDAPYQKRAAEAAVKRLNGIRGMRNHLVIESDLMARRVSQQIANTFALGARRDAHRIFVAVHDHRVTLSGSVRNVTERDEAEVAAWAVPGVAAVLNRIRAPT